MRKNKIQAYFKAKRMVDNGGTVKEATENAKITLATYYKYRRLFGDNEPNEKGMVEIVPQAPKINQSSKERELETIIKENSALREQIALRQELAKLVQ